MGGSYPSEPSDGSIMSLVNTLLATTSPHRATCIAYFQVTAFPVKLTLGKANPDETEKSLKLLRDMNIEITDDYNQLMTDRDMFMHIQLTALRCYRKAIKALKVVESSQLTVRLD